MALYHKRSAFDRDLTFYSPTANCYACYDTGIVSNADGLVNDYLPDYDKNNKGNRQGGCDLALICHCQAAYSTSSPDGSETKSGFRTGHGIYATESSTGGLQSIGSELDKERTREIHSIRKENWKKTTEEMNQIRVDIAKGKKVPTPWYIAEVKEQLKTLPDLFSFPSEKKAKEALASMSKKDA